MRFPSKPRHAATAAVVLLLVTFPAAAGQIDLAWDPSAGASGYKLYSGAQSGSYGSGLQVGNVTQTTFNSAPDCALSYFAVTAYNSAGESSPSNELASWPKPVLNGSNDPDGQRGERLTLVVSGNNFQPGASVTFSNSAITVNSVTVNSCGQITCDISVGGSAALGPVTITVANQSGIAASTTTLFSVVGDPLPTVPNLRRTDKQ